MNHFYIGIDIGTSATKAMVFTHEGKVINHCLKSYEMYHPQPDWSVQKPLEILTAVLECINNVSANITPQFISFSGDGRRWFTNQKRPKLLRNHLPNL